MCCMTKAISLPTIEAIFRPPLFANTAACHCCLRGQMQCSVLPQESRVARTRLQLYVASYHPPRHYYLPGAYCSLAAVANPRLFAPTHVGPSLISCVFIPQGGNRQSGGGVGGVSDLSRVSSAAKKFGISAQTPRSKLGRICSRPLQCSSSPSLAPPPPLLLPLMAVQPLMAPTCRTLSTLERSC